MRNLLLPTDMSNVAMVAFDADQPEVSAQAAEWVPMLRTAYALVDKDVLYEDALTETPSLYPLLREAIDPLRKTFPSSTIFRIEALKDDDSMLRVIARVPASAADAGERMRRFKENWWIQNCHRSEASLVFDYELGNGV